MRLPDLLATLANCKNARSVSIYDRRKVVSEQLQAKAQTARGWPSGVRQGSGQGAEAASGLPRIASGPSFEFAGC